MIKSARFIEVKFKAQVERINSPFNLNLDLSKTSLMGSPEGLPTKLQENTQITPFSILSFLLLHLTTIVLR